MAKADRLKIIGQIENSLNTKLICYVTGDRQNLATAIAEDAVRLIYSHLEGIGTQDRIALFLYTRGGHPMPAYRIVNLVREYCQKLIVLVPYRCHSAGTMICLGADQILMGKMGELSPVDPTTANAFNPLDAGNPRNRVPISVEDVRAYLSLAKDKAGLASEDKILEVFKSLTQGVHPVALGNINRVSNVTGLLVPKLLALHLDATKNEATIQKVAKLLAETYTHDYLIARGEAQKMGLAVSNPEAQVEASMWSLYEAYEKDLILRDPFNPEQMLGNQPNNHFRLETAYVESQSLTHAFVQEGDISRPQIPTAQPQAAMPQVLPINVKFTKQSWETV